VTQVLSAALAFIHNPYFAQLMCHGHTSVNNAVWSKVFSKPVIFLFVFIFCFLLQWKHAHIIHVQHNEFS
jgi:hypothetical protein